MGTNYYAVTDFCACCGREDLTHICKNLVMFRAYPGEGLVSWQAWKEYLLSDRVTMVVNEYGVEKTVEDFVASVEATDPTSRRRQYDWIVRHGSAGAGEDTLDPDGFSFYSGEFS